MKWLFLFLIILFLSGCTCNCECPQNTEQLSSGGMQTDNLIVKNITISPLNATITSNSTTLIIKVN